jgi:hypothetical protein
LFEILGCVLKCLIFNLCRLGKKKVEDEESDSDSDVDDQDSDVDDQDKMLMRAQIQDL